MRIVVIGSGAIGSLYGGWLLAAGGDVAFVARGTRFAAALAGWTADRGWGQSGNSGSQRGAGIERSPPADVLIFAVKLYDLDAAAQGRGGIACPGRAGRRIAERGRCGGAVWRSVRSRADHGRPVYSAATSDRGCVDRNGAAQRRGDRERSGRPILTPQHWSKHGARPGSRRRSPTIFGRRCGPNSCSRDQCRADLPGAPARGGGVSRSATARPRRAVDRRNRSGRTRRGSPTAAQCEAEALAILQGLPLDVVASMRQDLDPGGGSSWKGSAGRSSGWGKTWIATPVHDVGLACLKPFADGR